MKFLRKKINPDTGIWGPSIFNEPEKLSRAVQFAYHIFTLFNYDNVEIPFKEKTIDNVLNTQNRFGGYGTAINSSACEDIDSIELLIRLSKLTDYRKNDIRMSLFKSLPWVLANMNDDGGFVFSRNESFIYGHKEMSSLANESSMFATWFRTLCLAYLINFLKNENLYNINRTPGYEF